MSHKDSVCTFFSTLWTRPRIARLLCTEDVAWVRTRSMRISGKSKTPQHAGWDVVRCLRVAESGKNIDTRDPPETMEPPTNWFSRPKTTPGRTRRPSTCSSSASRGASAAGGAVCCTSASREVILMLPRDPNIQGVRHDSKGTAADTAKRRQTERETL